MTLIHLYKDYLEDDNLDKYDYIIAAYMRNLIEWEDYSFNHYRGSVKSLCKALNMDPDTIVNSLNHMIDIDLLSAECTNESLDPISKTYKFRLNSDYSPLILDIDESTGEIIE